MHFHKWDYDFTNYHPDGSIRLGSIRRCEKCKKYQMFSQKPFDFNNPWPLTIARWKGVIV